MPRKLILLGFRVPRQKRLGLEYGFSAYDTLKAFKNCYSQAGMNYNIYNQLVRGLPPGINGVWIWTKFHDVTDPAKFSQWLNSGFIPQASQIDGYDKLDLTRITLITAATPVVTLTPAPPNTPDNTETRVISEDGTEYVITGSPPPAGSADAADSDDSGDASDGSGNASTDDAVDVTPYDVSEDSIRDAAPPGGNTADPGNNTWHVPTGTTNTTTNIPTSYYIIGGGALLAVLLFLKKRKHTNA
jgi:hypothetical protein